MKLGPKDAGDDLEMDMSPMIDMVFLLLIFFIVASQIIDEKPTVSVPTAVYAKVPEEVKSRIMVSVTKDDVYFFENSECESFEEMVQKLQAAFEADPEQQILIRADGEVKFKVNEKIMKACAEMGAVNMIFAAFEE